MSGKLFTFNASSFTLDPAVEALLRSRGAITLDFGSSAYINSDLVPLIMAELVEKSSSAASEELVAQLKTDFARSEAQCQKMAEDGALIAQQLKSAGAEVASVKEQLTNASRTIESLKEQLAGANKTTESLKEQLTNASRTIESLKAESARLQVAQKSAPAPAIDRTQYDKVVRELQQLMTQNAEAITSLKVLEDENEELRVELDSLKGQAKAAPAPKAG